MPFLSYFPSHHGFSFTDGPVQEGSRFLMNEEMSALFLCLRLPARVFHIDLWSYCDPLTHTAEELLTQLVLLNNPHAFSKEVTI